MTEDKVFILPDVPTSNPEYVVLLDRFFCSTHRIHGVPLKVMSNARLRTNYDVLLPRGDVVRVSMRSVFPVKICIGGGLHEVNRKTAERGDIVLLPSRSYGFKTLRNPAANSFVVTGVSSSCYCSTYKVAQYFEEGN